MVTRPPEHELPNRGLFAMRIKVGLMSPAEWGDELMALCGPESREFKVVPGRWRCYTNRLGSGGEGEEKIKIER